MVKQAFLRLLSAALLSAGLMSAPVFAHAKLQSTSPAAGEQLGAAPKSLTLQFNENVQLAILRLSTAGTDIPVAFDRRAAASEVRVTLPALAPGKYQVQWSALSTDDGHVVKGTFSFLILAR